MAIANLVSELQAINLAIDGIQSAPQALPASVDTADLPAAFTFAGPGKWSKWGTAKGQIQLTRTYTIRVVAKPVAQGRGIDEGYQLAIALLQAFGDRYLFDLSLGGLVSGVGDLQDTGAIAMAFNKVEYWGFELSVPTVQKLHVSDRNLPVVPPLNHIHASGTPGSFDVP